MTRTQKKVRTSKNGQLEEALAILISCTHRKTRPLSLTEIAKWLDIAVGKMGSIRAVADRIGVSAKMLAQFFHVKKLSKDVQAIFEKRKLDSVDSTTQLAMLPEHEQKVVANALASRNIDTIDLRAVVELRRAGDNSSITSLLRRVSASKSKKEYVAEFVIQGSPSPAYIRKKFTRYIPASEILVLERKGVFGQLVLTQKGKNALAHTAKKLQTPLKRIIPAILDS